MADWVNELYFGFEMQRAIHDVVWPYTLIHIMPHFVINNHFKISLICAVVADWVNELYYGFEMQRGIYDVVWPYTHDSACLYLSENFYRQE